MQSENKRQIEIIIQPNKDAIKDLDIDKLTEETLTMISRYLPKWSPQENFKILIWNTSAEAGCYIGKWENNHHHLITISGENDISIPYKRMSLQIRIAHELFHQKSAELLKADDINEKGIENGLKHPMLAKMTKIERIEVIFGMGARSSFLQKIITEGCAVYGEQELCKAVLSSANFSSEEKRAVGDFLKARQTDLAHDDDVNSTYVNGYQLISRLIEQFGEQNLLTIVKKIDWKACGEIKNNSSEYANILNDPKLIPGLENVIN
jgi:hypothetical protein